MRLNYVSEVKLLCKRVSNNCLSEVKLEQMQTVAHIVDFVILFHFSSKVIFSKITIWLIYLTMHLPVFR